MTATNGWGGPAWRLEGSCPDSRKVSTTSGSRTARRELVTVVTELLTGCDYLISARRELHPTVPTDPSRGHRRPTFIPVGRLPFWAPLPLPPDRGPAEQMSKQHWSVTR